MPWEKVSFERVRATRVCTKRCISCDRRFRRQRTFQQTVNPWNKNADGTVKTRREVAESVNAEADAWAAEPMICTDCHGGTGVVAPC